MSQSLRIIQFLVGQILELFQFDGHVPTSVFGIYIYHSQI